MALEKSYCSVQQFIPYKRRMIISSYSFSINDNTAASNSSSDRVRGSGMSESVEIIVGNTYHNIPRHLAKPSRRTGLKKVHDVTIFVDIVNGGNPDVIEKVSFDLGSTFDPEVFTCTTPILTSTRNGRTKVWRFSTRQEVYGAFNASIKIRGAGGTSHNLVHEVMLQPNSEIIAHREPTTTFTEYRGLRPLPKTKLPFQARFGVELELSSVNYLPPDEVADYLASRNDCVVVQNYSEGRRTLNEWKIVPDSSIVCSTSQPDCNKFELVSPPLGAGPGLGSVHEILTRMENINPRLKVNKSMGFHVHVDVSGFDTSQLVKICQQFVKYESVIDMFMPRSRRSGSVESNSYFQSNRRHIQDLMGFGGGRATNRQVHDALGACQNMDLLVKLMNGSSRYFKLNMQNLATGRQPTLEFRQHSSTMNYEKIGCWIRFCLLFCWNSARLRAPKPFKEDSSLKKKFDALFQFVIKDRALRDYYRKRMDHFQKNRGEDDDCACCSSCAAGSSGHCPSKLY
eukprot:scaffold4805_cov136-Cylindrotheca_fusiformis.AAC.22